MTRKLWTPAEIESVRTRYPHELTRALAASIGRSERSVYQQADKLGLSKSAEYLASDKAGRIQRGKQHPNMIATRFAKGSPAWNKGLDYCAGGRSVETQFKPGRPAHEARNYKPIGSTRIGKEGLLERKVTDDPSLVPARRWVGVQRLVWEAECGPIPRGAVVVFKPGQHTTVETEIQIDRLELVTRAELMKRNSYHTRYPKEVAQLIQLRGALNRQINKRSRREKQD